MVGSAEHHLWRQVREGAYGTWFEALAALPPIEDAPGKGKLEVHQGKALAAFTARVEHVNKDRTKVQGEKWLRTALQAGTRQDKVGAMALLVQQDPIGNHTVLEGLMRMAEKSNKKESLLAVTSLRDLFVNNLCPPTRKLRFFSQQPYGHPGVSEVHLVYWHLEDMIKRHMARYVELLEVRSSDTIEFFKMSVLTCTYEILAAVCEQEQLLLSLLVNKIGDPERKVSSKAGFLLKSLVDTHPNMKSVVVREVEHLVLRPSVSPRSRYYGVVFLNQLVLTGRDGPTAEQLMDIYFALFRLTVKLNAQALAMAGRSKAQKRAAKKYKQKHQGKNKKGGKDGSGGAPVQNAKELQDASSAIDTRMLGALLTGVNRAFPFLPKDADNKFAQNLDEVFRLVHTAHFNTAVQALNLLQHVRSRNSEITDRFYRALYALLLSHDLPGTSKPAVFLNLLFKALATDSDEARLQAFTKRLLQVCFVCPPHLACGILYLIAKVRRNSRALQSANESQPLPGLDPKSDQAYDPQRRDPQFCHAQNTHMWELAALVNHYHPSVAAFATQFVQNKGRIEYKGDPLEDLTFTAFLDKFSYRNPKQNAKKHAGVSYMQPTKARNRSQAVPVNLQQYEQMKAKNVRDDELFFYKYFTSSKQLEKKKAKGKQKKKDKEESKDFGLLSDEEDESDEEGGGGLGAGGDTDLFDDDEVSFGSFSDDDEVLGGGGGGGGAGMDFGSGSDDDSEDMEVMDFGGDEESDIDDDDHVKTKKKGKKAAGKKSKHMDPESMSTADFEKHFIDEDDSDIDDPSARAPNKKPRTKTSGSVFAAADDFQHLLDSSGVEHAGVNPKQLAWEEKGAGARKRGRPSNSNSNSNSNRNRPASKPGRSKGGKQRGSSKPPAKKSRHGRK